MIQKNFGDKGLGRMYFLAVFRGCLSSSQSPIVECCVNILMHVLLELFSCRWHSAKHQITGIRNKLQDSHRSYIDGNSETGLRALKLCQIELGILLVILGDSNLFSCAVSGRKSRLVRFTISNKSV